MKSFTSNDEILFGVEKSSRKFFSEKSKIPLKMVILLLLTMKKIKHVHPQDMFVVHYYVWSIAWDGVLCFKEKNTSMFFQGPIHVAGIG